MARQRKTQNLTVNFCQKATYVGSGRGKCIFWDSVVSNLGLRVYPETNKKVWVVEYRDAKNQPHLMTLRGTFPGVTPDAARKAAQAYLGEAARGVDPLAEREALKRSTDGRIDSIAQRYIEEKLNKQKTGSQRVRHLKQLILPTWGKKLPEEITSKTLTDWYRKLLDRGPILAIAVHATFRAMLKWAQRRELIPVMWTLPAVSEDVTATQRERETFIPEERLGDVMESLEADRNPVALILRLMLLTGARPGEWRCSCWSWLDKSRNALVVPWQHHKTGYKTKKDRVIPLSEDAWEILKGIPRNLDSDLIFVSRYGERIAPFDQKSLINRWTVHRKRLGLDHVTVYDLRRTAATMLATRGVPLQVIAEILGHKDLKTTQIYARLAARVTTDAASLLGDVMSGRVDRSVTWSGVQRA